MFIDAKTNMILSCLDDGEPNPISAFNHSVESLNTLGAKRFANQRR